MTAPEFLAWVPAIVVTAGVITSWATMRAAQRASDRRHDGHDKRLDEHESRIRSAENAITGLKVFDELQARRSQP